MITPKGFYNKYDGLVIDDDGAFGAQCVDGYRVLCREIGVTPYPTPNGWADGYWYGRESHAEYFDFIEGSNNYQDGDVVVWAKGSNSHPYTHIAMYLVVNGVAGEFGENQGLNNGGFSWKETNFADSLGALRPKVWVKKIDLPTEEDNAVYRIYNPNSSEHFFTESHAEATRISSIGWEYEGVAFHTGDGEPVYRLYNSYNGTHMFTVSAYERDNLINAGWNDEGVAWKSKEDGADVYRLYNPNNGQHMFTSSGYEKNSLVNVGWNDEGVAFKG